MKLEIIKCFLIATIRGLTLRGKQFTISQQLYSQNNLDPESYLVIYPSEQTMTSNQLDKQDFFCSLHWWIVLNTHQQNFDSISM